jgi:hypothetical protein
VPGLDTQGDVGAVLHDAPGVLQRPGAPLLRVDPPEQLVHRHVRDPATDIQSSATTFIHRARATQCQDGWRWARTGRIDGRRRRRWARGEGSRRSPWPPPFFLEMLINWSPPKRPGPQGDPSVVAAAGQEEGEGIVRLRLPPHWRLRQGGISVDLTNALRFLPFSRTVRRALPRPCSAVVGRPVRSHPPRQTWLPKQAPHYYATARSLQRTMCDQTISDGFHSTCILQKKKACRSGLILPSIVKRKLKYLMTQANLNTQHTYMVVPSVL